MSSHVHLRLVKGPVNTIPLLIKWRDDFLLIKRNKSRKTYQMYEIVLNQFIDFVGDDLWPPTHSDLLSWFEAMQKRGLSKTTIHTYWRQIKAWFRYIHVLGGFGNRPNPAEMVKVLGLTPRKAQKIPKGFAKNDVDALFNHLRGLPETPLNLRDLAMLHLLYRSGMRSGEVVTLERANLALRQNFVYIEADITKTDADRQAFFGRAVVRDILAWLDVLDARDYEHPWLFPSFKVWGKSIIALERHITPRGALEMLKRRLKAAGLPDNTIHAFRHTFTREAMQAGKPLNAIQRQLGHRSPAMVLYYAQAWRSDQEEAFKDWGD